MILPAMERKTGLRLSGKKSQYDGCWNGADIYVNNTKVCAINKAFYGYVHSYYYII